MTACSRAGSRKAPNSVACRRAFVGIIAVSKLTASSPHACRSRSSAPYLSRSQSRNRAMFAGE